MKKISLLAPVILLMVIIFSFSSQPYKDQDITPWFSFLDDSKFAIQLLSWISFQYGGSEVSIAEKGVSHFLEFFIRKGAHFTIYFLLAYFTVRAFKGLFSKRKSLIIPISYLFVVLYAISDEIHQGFTGGRTPLVSDVILDSIGGAFGVICFFLFHQKLIHFFKRVF